MFRVLSTLLLALLAFTLRKVGSHAPLPVEPPAPPAPDRPSVEAGHEASEPGAGAIGAIVAGLFLTIIISMVVLGWVYVRLYSTQPAMPAPTGETRFSYAMEAKSSIADDWAAINRQAHDRLETFGWVSRGDGVAHIPVERAMQVIAERGVPARQVQTPVFPAPEDEKRPLIETEGGDHALKSY